MISASRVSSLATMVEFLDLFFISLCRWFRLHLVSVMASVGKVSPIIRISLRSYLNDGLSHSQAVRKLRCHCLWLLFGEDHLLMVRWRSELRQSSHWSTCAGSLIRVSGDGLGQGLVSKFLVAASDQQSQ